MAPIAAQEETARKAVALWSPEQELPNDPRNFWTLLYGIKTHNDLFTGRQLLALGTFSNLVAETMERVWRDAVVAGLPNDKRALRDGGIGAMAYAEAVAVYLAFAVDKSTAYWNTLCLWLNQPKNEIVSNSFGRQAFPMTWDFAEANPLSGSGGNIEKQIGYITKVLTHAVAVGEPPGLALQSDATAQALCTDALISTDPPYYDNIGYADLSDFFYLWLRRSLKSTFPDLFATLAVPKAEELVATPYRHGSKAAAEIFFLDGMTQALRRLAEQAHPAFPATIYYAFKQSETRGDTGTASTGWETFLDAVIRSGHTVTGTWPMRTERPTALKVAVNALASSIVLVCRRRSAGAETASRRQFLAALRSELPLALADLQTSNVAPVDLAQAAIGPGMAVFTRYGQVLEADGSPMSVRSALMEINRVLDETLAKQEGDLDADTRFCVAWYEQFGMTERAYGEAEVLFSAKNTSFEGLRRAGVIAGGKGKVRIVGRDQLDGNWDPAVDGRITDWESAQHLTRALTAEEGGGVAEAGRLVFAMGGERAERARALAYRLYAVADRKRWAEEAHVYNVLVSSWPQIQAEVVRLGAGGEEQGELGLAGEGHD